MRRSVRGWGGAGAAQWNSPTTKTPERPEDLALRLSGQRILAPPLLLEPTVPVETEKRIQRRRSISKKPCFRGLCSGFPRLPGFGAEWWVPGQAPDSTSSQPPLVEEEAIPLLTLWSNKDIAGERDKLEGMG